MTLTKFCPTVDPDCPYYEGGTCGLPNPYWDCDDFAADVGEDSDEAKEWVRRHFAEEDE